MIKTLYDPVVEEKAIKKVALAALKEGLNLDMIRKITGLDKKTILELKEKNPDQ